MGTMNPASSGLLDQLAPAHASAPPGLWPLAPGWWLLIVITLGIATGVVIWYRRASRRLRTFALREVRRLELDHASDPDLAGALENLLRRYAVARFGRDTVARLSGKSWVAFLAEHGGASLAGEVGEQFLRAAYGGQSDCDRVRWLAGTRGFIRSAA